MRKRGPIIVSVGTIMVIVSMSVAYSIVPRIQSGFNGQDIFPAPESMFDNVTDKVTIDSGNVYTFSHSVNTANVTLMWGLHIVDYKQDDRTSITINNIFGDKFGVFTDTDPIFIKSFEVSKVDTYNFNVQNIGKNSITAIMMFTENPEKSKALTDPNSPFIKNIIPLALAGFILIIGFVILISGVILTVVDWRKSKNQSRFI